VAFEHAQRDAEQNVESIEEHDIPHTEKRLSKKRKEKVTTSNERPDIQCWDDVPRRGGSR
jgi:hypothetical protein